MWTRGAAQAATQRLCCVLTMRRLERLSPFACRQVLKEEIEKASPSKIVEKLQCFNNFNHGCFSFFLDFSLFHFTPSSFRRLGAKNSFPRSRSIGSNPGFMEI